MLNTVGHFSSTTALFSRQGIAFLWHSFCQTTVGNRMRVRGLPEPDNRMMQWENILASPYHPSRLSLRMSQSFCYSSGESGIALLGQKEGWFLFAHLPVLTASADEHESTPQADINEL
jgi:hypothetical protein